MSQLNVIKETLLKAKEEAAKLGSKHTAGIDQAYVEAYIRGINFALQTVDTLSEEEEDVDEQRERNSRSEDN